ncbi:hypothetical protein ATANTOWER_028413, partial [Ataeniobius toweri]|nr:hypothetical protein [Ataeniobius toweri]
TSISPVKPENVTPPVSALFSPERRAGISPSYIELETTTIDLEWQEHVTCESCSLSFHDNCIYVNNGTARSLFFIYAQVVFKKREKPRWSVKLIRNGSIGKSEKVEAQVLGAASRLVWMGRIITLTGGDSVTLNITGEYQNEETFWGAFQLH